MEQLDLFNSESGNKVAVIRPKQHQSKNKKEEVAAADEKTEKNQPQLIKPLSKKPEQPVKRGRKSLKEINLDVALLDVPADEILFQKQYYSISEVAVWFNMKPSLLRFW
ncbi:MAG TPA: hypothetical protein VGI61_12890 [Parafilimonas sp.]